MGLPCGNQWYSNMWIGNNVLVLHSMYEGGTGITLWNAAVGWTLI